MVASSPAAFNSFPSKSLEFLYDTTFEELIILLSSKVFSFKNLNNDSVISWMHFIALFIKKVKRKKKREKKINNIC